VGKKAPKVPEEWKKLVQNRKGEKATEKEEPKRKKKVPKKAQKTELGIIKETLKEISLNKERN